MMISFYTDPKYFCSKLHDHNAIDSDVLLTTMFYLETWKQGSTAGPDEELEKLLEDEDFSEAPIPLIKQYLISFATSTTSTKLFAETIGTLMALHDETLQPLFTTWVLSHLQKTLEHHSALHQLLVAIQRLDDRAMDRTSSSLLEIEANIEDARGYIMKELGIHVPC